MSAASLLSLEKGSVHSNSSGSGFDIESNNTNASSTNSIASTMDAQIHPPPRSESMAYSNHSAIGNMWSRFVYYVRFNTKAFLAGVGLLILAVVMLTEDSPGPSVYALRGGVGLDHWGGAVHPGYFKVEDSVVDDHTFRFAVVTDLDKLSVVKDAKKPLFRSTLLPGVLTRNDGGRYAVKFEPHRTLVSEHNEAGRGMELSELTVYRNRLLSFDDRTGTVFELLSSSDGNDSYVVPRFVITEGDGDTDKGMKWEWATIKNNELILGSMGKEYTNPDGSVANTNNLWVAVLNDRGEIRRDDWQDKFNFVRNLVGASPPGCKLLT